MPRRSLKWRVTYRIGIDTLPKRFSCQLTFGCFCLPYFNVLFSNPIEMKYSVDVFEGVQITYSKCFKTLNKLFSLSFLEVFNQHKICFIYKQFPSSKSSHFPS